MNQVVWSQWDDLEVPAGFTRLSPATTSLDDDDLSQITFYIPLYMGSKKALEYSRKMPSLRYLQLLSAGYEDAVEYLRPGIELFNARGVHDESTAELAVGLAIAVRRGFAEFARNQGNGVWDHKRNRALTDSNIAIIGAGSIANTLKNFLTPYNVEINLYSRSGSNGSRPISELDKYLPTTDIVFLLMPLNDESRKMFDARRLSLLKDGAAVINVARGGVIDTNALVAELNSGRLFAGLDVTDPEPLPRDHPLWSAPNCIITPPVGGDSSAFEPRGKRLAEEQLHRLSIGEELINLVARG